ncbi:Trefoil factor 1 [Varanus komodoensis]|nr:Trefoil factor 1 [Varanus komodoensis]
MCTRVCACAHYTWFALSLLPSVPPATGIEPSRAAPNLLLGLKELLYLCTHASSVGIHDPPIISQFPLAMLARHVRDEETFELKGLIHVMNFSIHHESSTDPLQCRSMIILAKIIQERCRVTWTLFPTVSLCYAKKMIVPQARTDCGYPGISRKRCKRIGCCFDPQASGAPVCFYPPVNNEKYINYRPIENHVPGKNRLKSQKKLLSGHTATNCTETAKVSRKKWMGGTAPPPFSSPREQKAKAAETIVHLMTVEKASGGTLSSLLQAKTDIALNLYLAAMAVLL